MKRLHWPRLEELRARAELALTQPAPAEPPPPPGLTRRQFLAATGAGLALAGLDGCCGQWETEPLLPYSRRPPDVTPGIPSRYATSMIIDGYAVGLLVQSHAGRPTKVEGNPDHPASLGAAGPFQQASVYQLYDPDRAFPIVHAGERSTWDQVAALLGAPRQDRGAGLRVLLEPTSSPLLAALIDRVRERHPEARFAFYSPLATDSVRQGADIAFGTPGLPLPDYSRAWVVVTVDDDFLSMGPMFLRHAREWSQRRRIDRPEDAMMRLYAIETMLTPTGSMADLRLALPGSRIPGAMVALASAVLTSGRARVAPPQEVRDLLAGLRGGLAPETLAFVDQAAEDLLAAGPAGLVTVGDRQPPPVHALAWLVNSALGSVGQAVWMIPPQLVDAGPATQSLLDFTTDLAERRADTVVILEANPSYTAPVDLGLAGALRAVPTSVCLGLYHNETARDCGTFVPAAHFLESWGDARAYDGTVSTLQPLIEPLHGGHTVAEVLAVLAGERHGARQLVEGYWTERLSEARWKRSLRQGFVAGTAADRRGPSLRWERYVPALRSLATRPVTAAGVLDANFVPSHQVYDGRFANNPWLQEMAQPITTITWDNAAYLSPTTARRLGVEGGDLIELAAGGQALRIAVFVLPGHADDAVTLPLGYGRRGTMQRPLQESVAEAAGFDTYQLRTLATLAGAGALQVVRVFELHDAVGRSRLESGRRWPETLGSTVRVTPAHYTFAMRQLHFEQHDRPIALVTTLAGYRADPGFTRTHKGPLPSLLPVYIYPGDQWAMSIDLTVCTACSSCVVACVAENNVMVVGKEGVWRGRTMHWLRIDTYFTDSHGGPAIVHQPMMCQHCQKAPCEYVCPVYATLHSPDGLNEMIYNRCVGTRWCSNNCPYKIRRFNWFDWKTRLPRVNQGPLIDMQRNPEVTVRGRGVMEKCTYCVQRIRTAQIRASIERRPLAPDAIQTACQQACPTRAIEFGSLAHRDTRMVKYREQHRSYAVLHDEGTRPRTMYLARVNNPPPPRGGRG